MVRKCTSRGIAEIAVMEVAHQVGVRTRARAALAVATAAASSATAKRRKVSGETATEGELVKLSTTTTSPTSYVELRNRKRVVIASENLFIPSSTAENNIGVRTTAADEEQGKEEEQRCVSPSSSDREVQASCCSSNGSASEIANHDDDQERSIEFVDLEDDDDDNYESGEVETSTYNFCREIRREMTPSSKLREESDDMESSAKQTVVDSNRRSVAVAEKIMPSELEIEEFFKAAEKDIQKRFAEKYNYDIVKDTPLEGRYEWVRLKP